MNAAVESGRVEVIEYLLNIGANVNSVDEVSS